MQSNRKPHLPQATQVVTLQNQAVIRWHEQDFDNPHSSLLQIICQQHESNFRLWHQEDIARSPRANDAEIAKVKRAIDRLNQSRNDLIEAIDDAITTELATVIVAPDARLNTETIGSVIDRLSILSLRIFHYQEQLTRTGQSDAFYESARGRVQVCQRQQADLSQSLQELMDEVVAGRKHHRTYRQLKMYNDPQLNPAIYDAKNR